MARVILAIFVLFVGIATLAAQAAETRHESQGAKAFAASAGVETIIGLN